jgi:DNA-binding MarR family transcriptional regulator
MATSRQSGALSDPIDEAVRQWEAHGLGAIDHMEATTAINRMHQLLAASIERELRAFRISFAQYEALVLLHFSKDGILPLGHMGRRLMIHPATVTNTINQLESKKLVQRLRNDSDQRVVLARLTPLGRDVAVAASKALVDVKFGIADMTDREAQAIASTISAYRRRVSDT